MEKDLYLVLESVLKYQKKEQMIITFLFFFIMIVIGVFVAVRFRKMTAADKCIACVIVIAFLICFLVYITDNKRFQSCILSDIQTEDYVEYAGHFTHDNYQKDSFYHNIYVLDDLGSKLLLRYPDYSNQHETYSIFEELPFGSYEGTIIFGRSSKIVVSWSIAK